MRGMTPKAQIRKKARFFAGFNGGRGWDRTSDPYDVNVVLIPCKFRRHQHYPQQRQRFAHAVPTSPQLLHRVCPVVGADGRVPLDHPQ
jgi:hypothetical protein